MTVDTETLLPEPSTTGDVLTGEVTTETAVGDLKSAEEILLDATNADGSGPTFTLPTTSSPDLFGGELGEYELNEIPSLFNLDTQQMSADLESLGFSASGADGATTESSTEIPFITSSASIVSTAATLASATNTEKEPNDNNKATPAPKAASKRSAAEISEDEDSQASKTRRVTRASSVQPVVTTSSTTTTARRVSAAPVPVSPPAASRRPLAPKPTTTKKGGATTKNVVTTTTSDADRKIDTSTAHVKALTGAKGAAMCFEIVSGTDRDTTVAIPNLASADLTPEEKAKFSRDRNRLHARNTRIRKKAYVDELKRTLDVLVKERDSVEAAKNHKMQVEREERDVRYSVLEEFLRLRGRNEQVPARWSAILEDNITLHLPNLEFRGSGGGGAAAGKKMVSGVTDLMKECNDFTKQMQAGKRGTRRTAGFLTFQCDRTSLLMEGCSVVLDWTATSTDPAKANMLMRGTCRASFNPQSNKLHAVELFFDSSPLMA